MVSRPEADQYAGVRCDLWYARRVHNVAHAYERVVGHDQPPSLVRTGQLQIYYLLSAHQLFRFSLDHLACAAFLAISRR